MNTVAYRMKNTVQAYDWGHPDFIRQFLGAGPELPSPQAELWMGSHPKAPSVLELPAGPQALDACLARDPAAFLGPQATAAGWTDLPFLFKLLAAGKALSIQCHPSLAAAKAGFQRENQAGIPLAAGQRNYKDPNHKPEIICAVTEFYGLCGYRPAAEIARDLADLRDRASPALAAELGSLASLALAGDLKGLTRAILELRPRQAELARDLLAAFAGRPEPRFSFMAEAARDFPGDIGLMFFLVLKLVRLEAGQGIFIPAGVLHAYVKGIGIEVMANSDNVLRGGLTPKHIDIPELMANLDPAIEVAILQPAQGDGLTEYQAPVPEFRLQRLAGTGRRQLGRNGSPEIILCMSGSVSLELAHGQTLVLAKGQSAYVMPGSAALELVLQGEAMRVFIPLGA